MLMNVGDEPVHSKNGLLTTIAWQIGEKITYALDGGVYCAGAAFQWLRDSMHFIQEYDEIDKMCMSLSDNAGVYFVTAFSGLAAPYWDQYARGTIVGITAHTQISHMVRAATESIAYQVNNVLNCMNKSAGVNLSYLNVDGGVTKSNFLMQFQADISNIKVCVSNNNELTAKGAAMFAGLHIGFWSSLDELSILQKDYCTFSPSMEKKLRETLIQDWDMAIERSLNWENRSSSCE